MVRPLGIFTAGGLARAVASHFSAGVFCFVDEPREPNEEIHNIPVLSKPPLLPKHYPTYVIGCGDPHRRKSLAEKHNVEWISLIHETATVSRNTNPLGEGTIICPGVGIDPDVTIGKHVYIDYNSVIGHGATIGNYTVIGPLVLVAGYCEIGETCYIGAGAKIVKEAKIGNGAVIGAGAVVLNDVPSGEVWAGVPARRIK